MSAERANRDTRRPIRVFLVDDHDIVRRSVRDLMHLSGGIEVVGEDGSARTAAARILQADPDVAVIDLRLGDGSGVDVCRAVRSGSRRIATLVLTADDTEQARIAAVLAGASGYVSKLVRGGDLIETVRQAAGRDLLDESDRAAVRSRLARDHAHDLKQLTAWEEGVLAHVVQGHGDHRIATELGVGDAEVTSCVRRLLVKLGALRDCPTDERLLSS